ncbi:MAG: polyprenol monophosphomannose synthase [Phycisphaerae bacterium]|nr:polyprenol monophosphomannose synthase [Phycisphaerae bacterium]
MPAKPAAVSIVVPTFREAENIPELTRRVFEATRTANIQAELILVDDNSGDGTGQVVERLQADYAVSVIVRRNERGLSSAVLAGFDRARHDRLVVLDADLQHPPEAIPALVEALDADDHDFAIATRYGRGGGIDSDWPLLRRIISRTATLLARPVAPLSDPMSGFFALHRRTWKGAARLDPIGYKIALELYVKGRCRRPAEVPIRFAPRRAGESKLTLAEQWRYIRHLSRLYRFRYPWLLPSLIAVLVLASLGFTLWLLGRSN